MLQLPSKVSCSPAGTTLDKASVSASLCHQTVWCNLLEASWISLTVSFPNSFHNQVFISATMEAVVLLAWYLSDELVVSWVGQPEKPVFKPGGFLCCPVSTNKFLGCTTLRPQLRASTLATEALNFDDSACIMPPTCPRGMQDEWDVESEGHGHGSQLKFQVSKCLIPGLIFWVLKVF